MTNDRATVPGQVTSTQSLGPACPQQMMLGKNNSSKTGGWGICFLVKIGILPTSKRLEEKTRYRRRHLRTTLWLTEAEAAASDT